MKTKNVTFSLPTEVIETLHSLVGKKGLSYFVTKALQKALEEKMQDLRAEYKAANDDPDRLKTIQEWESLEQEGWDE